MRWWLLTVFLLASHSAVAEDRWPTSSGGGTDDDEYLVMFDETNLAAANYTSGNCMNFGHNQGQSAACGILGSTSILTPAATFLTRWRVYLTTAPAANSGCSFTLLTDTGDVATTTKPALGDAAEAGYTILSTTSTGYLEVIPAGAANATTSAGGWFSIRFNDVAGASAGDDGNCANASNSAGSIVFIYGHAQ